MNKIVRIVLVLMVAIMASSLTAEARGRGGYHGHGGGHVGFGLYLGPGWWDPYPYYPYYYRPPVVVSPPQDIYVQPAPAPRAEEPNYWYYCQDPEGYYPYVKKCPKGWMKVVPPDEPPEDLEEEE